MTESILVFILAISSMSVSTNMANQLGPYSDLASCAAVKNSAPFKDYNSACIQVRVPIQSLPVGISVEK